jgi:excinuclease ABC subunit C
VSHVQGTNVVASMVVFEDGLARKSEYRRFIVKAAQLGPAGNGSQQIDDTAAMHEVLTRRFRRFLDDRSVVGDIEGMAIDPDTGRPRRFAYPPNLVVVDGGLPQVNAAAAALAELGIDDIALVGLAKRLEEVWLPGQEFPVILPRTSEGLYLLQRVRDEAHRFAITFHRQRRSKAMTASELDDIAGLGEVRRKALLRHFGSVKRLKGASVEQIREVPGIGPALAATIHETLHESATQAEPAVDMTTGELLT